jgi:hypothetical protein
MTTLKVLVFGMAVLLILGFGVLIGGIVMKLQRMDGGGFGAAEVTLPAGARVVETTVSADRVIVRIALPDGEERLQVIDVANGRTVGTIAIKRAP